MTKDMFFNQDKTYFFSDAKELAAYAALHCPEDAKAAIASADAVCGQSFMFSTRWDMERTWKPEVFPGEINWHHQPGDDPEWVYAFNRMRFWVTLGQAYAMKGDEKYARTFVSQMTGWVKNVRRNNPANEKAWRSIEAGIRLENWLKAIMYFRNSPALTDEAVSVFAESVAEHAEFIMGVWDNFNLISNWGVLANHGLFMAGVFLPETPRTREYLAESIKRLDLMARIQVYNDGCHWEQSPMYHNEVLRCYLDVLLLAKRNDIKLTDGIVEKTRLMLHYTTMSAKPNHCELCMGDSDNIDQRDIITIGDYVFGIPDKSLGYLAPDFDTIWDLGLSCWLNHASGHAPSVRATDFAAHNSGNFFFRSSWDEQATFVHFHCGTLGSGHGHADKLHVDIFSRGQDVLTDAGRFTYVFGKERVAFKELRAHNTIMADGTDIYVQKDSWESTRLARPVNRAFYADSRYGYAEGAHTGYTDAGVLVNRRVIYLKPDIVILCDEFYAKGKHLYEQFYHFGKSGTLAQSEGGYIFTSPDVTARMRILGNDRAEMTESFVAPHYNICVRNDALVVSETREGFACVYTVFAMSSPANAPALSVEKLPVKSNFKNITFGDDEIEALEVKFGSAHYIAVIAHREYACPTDTFNAGGCTGFGSCVIFDKAAGEDCIGTVLSC